MSDTIGNPLDDPATDPFEVAAAAADDIARLTGIERHDIALTLGSGWAKAAELIGETTATFPATEVTGFSRPIIVQSQDEKKHPQILVLGEGNEAQRKILMPAHAILMVQEGEKVLPGDILSKIPRATQKTKDITGGLPRVVDLFEARHPKDPAVMAEVAGFDGQRCTTNTIAGRSDDGAMFTLRRLEPRHARVLREAGFDDELLGVGLR